MLPFHASPNEKMNRHGYGGGGHSPSSIDSPTSPVKFVQAGRANTMGESGRGFRIGVDKYEKCVQRNKVGSRVER